MAKFVIQPHVRLQEWVAEEHGYFAAQGLDYEFEASSFAGGSQTATTVGFAEIAAQDIRAGAFEDIEHGRSSDVSSACHWVLNATASPETGKMWGRGYSIVPSGIFVQPDSPYKKPEHLAGVPVAVGYHSGSHYSAVQGLEAFIAKDEISLSFAGRPIDRVRLMLQGELQATNVFGAQFYLLAQLGFHKLIDTTFIVGFLLSPRTSTDDAEALLSGAGEGAARHRSAAGGCTSTTGCTNCRAIWRRSPTCAGTARASESCSSHTPRRCSPPRGSG